MKEEDSLCRVCGREIKTWEHIWEECGTKGKGELAENGGKSVK
jgi:hypothetical protein